MFTSTVIAALLEIVAEKVLDAVLAKSTETAIDALLHAEESRRAFKVALGQAIQRYSTNSNRLAIAKPLLEKNGPLADERVVTELAHILRFDFEPNYEVIGQQWKASFDEPPFWINFTSEAKLLVTYLRDELIVSEVFGPVFDSQNLSTINLNVAVASETLLHIEDQLKNLLIMMMSNFGELERIFIGCSVDINSQIRDFTWYIEEKTNDFVGRDFVFKRFKSFTEDNLRGYFFVQGDPGIGKTALSAQLVKTQGYVHHFNIRPLGINRADSFLKNICAQLIAAYHLNYSFLPPETTQDAGFLIKLLNDISGKLRQGEKAIIVIDALDEVEDQGSAQGTNILFLPITLPKGIFIFATSRKTNIHLRIECDQEALYIEQDSQDNINDIRKYIEYKANQQEIQNYLANQDIKQDKFVDYLINKSQGNFMYLRYVLPEIARGAYKDVNVAALPLGLMNYYEDHWQRMRIQSENTWLEYKLPIVIALSIVQEPISIDLISNFSKILDRRRIHAVLNEWQQFLYERKAEIDGKLQPRYRVYHDSFREFIAGKDEVEGEYVDLKKAHGVIADTLWNEIFGNKDTV